MDATHLSPYRADGKLYGFVCVVTGSDQAIGKAIVHELAAHGAACIYETAGNPIADSIQKTWPNTKVIDYPLHPTDEQDTLALIDELLNAWGRLDVWVTSCGTLGPATVAETSPADLAKCFEYNSVAPFLALKYAPAAMSKLSQQRGAYPNASPKDQVYGSIIVVSSVASTYGGCWGPSYTMSSHAALGLVRAGVTTLNGTGVRINCISPGQIANSNAAGGDLPQSNGDVTRAGLPAEVARVAGFLASGFSSYMTGANMVVDGGASAMKPLTLPV